MPWGLIAGVVSTPGWLESGMSKYYDSVAFAGQVIFARGGITGNTVDL